MLQQFIYALINMKISDFLHMVGSRIRIFRKAKRLSQEKLAELAGLHPTYVSDIERGKVNASLFSFHLIASALEIDCSDLVRLSPQTLASEIESELVLLLIKVHQLEKKELELFVTTAKSIVDRLDSINS